LWQSPDGKRVIFTTQGAAVDGGLQGSVCEALLGGGAPPRCIGPPVNKSQGLIDLPDQGRLLAVQWGVPVGSDSLGALIFELPREGPISILAEHPFDEMFADGFYVPSNSTLCLFSDRYNGIHRVSLPRFERMATIPATFAPGELHYDPVAGEGVACSGGIGAAIRGDPATLRYLSDGASFVEQFAVTWGCDWDPQARKVYTTIANLGLLERIDFDTGRVEKRWFVGPGMRSVAYDQERRRVYFVDFLRGYVHALDERSGDIVARWFVGRFSRQVQLSRDKRVLLATGNLGIVRIALDP
jgi:hypothetical protein